MKKNSLYKIIFIFMLIFMFLSWIIPTGSFSSGTFTKGTINQIGLFDIILYSLANISSSVFILMSLIVLLIGAFYGVLSKTSAYKELIDKIVKKYENHREGVIIFTTCFFTIMSSLAGITMPLLILFPFFTTILMLLGYDKIKTMLATIGAILVGNMASTYGNNIAGYISNLTENINSLILVRVILLALSLMILLFTVLKSSDKKTKYETIYFYDKKIKAKGTKTYPIVISFILIFIFLNVGMYNFKNIFDINLFNDIHSAIINFKIDNYAIFSNIIGSMQSLGNWNNYEVAFMLIVFTGIISCVYKIKKEDVLDGIKEGIKIMIPVALIVMAANIIFLLMNVNSSGQTFFNTIINNLIKLTPKFNIISFSIVSLLGSLFYNDYPYLLSIIYTGYVSYSAHYNIIGIASQMFHGLVQLVAPTSVFLVAGLTYLDIPYFEWLKNIWKLLLSLFVIIIAILIIVIVF